MVLLGITGAILALSALHHYSGVDLIQNLVDATDGEVAAFDSTMSVLAVLYLLAYVVGAVGFLAWLSRAIDNVPALGGGMPRVSPRWSIGWWFVPFANFVMPYRAVKDLHQRMTAHGQDAGSIVGWWWALFLVWNLFSNAASVYDYTSVSEAVTHFELNAAADVVGVAAAVVAIVMIRRIQRNADPRLAASGSTQSAAPAVASTSAPIV